MQASRVSIRKCNTTTRGYLAIIVNSHDLIFSCDLVNARQLKLAERLAEDNGLALEICVDASELPTK